MYQAITNIFSNQIFTKRKEVESSGVFANKLNHPDNIFMFERWQINYRDFQSYIIDKFKHGNHWVASFDLSEFFTTIDHDLLIRSAFPRGGNDELSKLIKDILILWSSTKHKFNAGIPQGPISSYLLAESYFLDIDFEMIKQKKYARYVDDIFLLGKSEKEVLGKITKLDLLCKEKGLIPNLSKFKIKRFLEKDELMEVFPVWFSYNSNYPTKLLNLKNAIKKIRQSINGNIVKDISKFKYTLNRSPNSIVIVRLLIQVLESNPGLAEEIFRYFREFPDSEEIFLFCRKLIISGFPYDYIIGASWEILATFNSFSFDRGLIDIAIDIRKNKTYGNYSRLGAGKYLLAAEKNGFGKYSSWVKFEPNHIQCAFLAPYVDLTSDGGKEVFSSFHRKSSADPGLGFLYSLFSQKGMNAKLPKIEENLHPTVENCYLAMNLISRRSRFIHNPIGKILQRRYNISNWMGWQQLFGSEYKHANSIISAADAQFDSDRSSWLGYIDSFCHIMFTQFQNLINQHGVNGAISLVNRNGDPITYGSLIRNRTFSNGFPVLANKLEKIHTRRNKIPSSHPYDFRTQQKSMPLSHREFIILRNDFKIVLDEIINVLKNYI